jgi:imidazoleglycerol-phosphate dehydratase/histidinol-phosphatase
MKKRVLFIDRDGTLIEEPADQQIDSLEKVEYLPYLFSALGEIVRNETYELVMVTNQDGLGTASFPEENFWPAQEKLLRALENEGIKFHAVHIDRSREQELKPTRKPGTAMLTDYFSEAYDLKNSVVIGDRLTDLMLAKNLGSKVILIRSAMTPETIPAELNPWLLKICNGWRDVSRCLLLPERNARVLRRTNETAITVELNLNGKGNAAISTGLGFFDHMLEQVARHSQADLTIQVNGDLHIDEHHTIEDTAIALGEAFHIALGNKRGISRYGFCLPMDDCLAQIALDFGGRPWIVWETEFKREKIGDVPTEMFFHFFKSFCDNARCNLNIKAEGHNEHHKIEAIFKAFAKSIRMAVKQDGYELPTTKGIL